jgi:hypothetical protein
MSKIKEINQKIEDAVVGGYKKIEEGVVDGYKKIEDGVVSGYKKIEDKFIDTFLAEEGETTEEARARLTGKENAE